MARAKTQKMVFDGVKEAAKANSSGCDALHGEEGIGRGGGAESGSGKSLRDFAVLADAELGAEGIGEREQALANLLFAQDLTRVGAVGGDDVEERAGPPPGGAEAWVQAPA